MKIPKAEDFIDQHYNESWRTEDFMIEFAKLHVKAALEKASEDAEVEDWAELNGDTGTRVDKKSILNAYPDELIK